MAKKKPIRLTPAQSKKREEYVEKEIRKNPDIGYEELKAMTKKKFGAAIAGEKIAETRKRTGIFSKNAIKHKNGIYSANRKPKRRKKAAEPDLLIPETVELPINMQTLLVRLRRKMVKEGVDQLMISVDGDVSVRMRPITFGFGVGDVG